MGNKITNKKLNLLEAYELSLIDPHRYDRIKRIAPLIGLASILLVTFVTLFILRMRVNSEIDSYNSQIKTTQKAIDATDKTPYENLQKMQSALADIKSIDQTISSKTKFTRTRLESLLTLAKNNGITFSSVSFTQEGSKIDIACSSANVTSVNKFVNALSADENYSNVSYTGYSESSSSSTVDSGAVDPTTGEAITTEVTNTAYTFNVSFTLNQEKEA